MHTVSNYCTLIAEVSSSFGGHKTSYFTTDESKSEDPTSEGKRRKTTENCFGEAKTSRYNRPPHDKKILEKREKIATRQSHRIKQLLDEKIKLDEVITDLLQV